MRANVLRISIFIILLAFNCVVLSKSLNRQTSNNRQESDRSNLRPHHRINKLEYRRSSRLNRNTPQRFRNCAIMYRNQEPVGILQPFEKSFKLLPVRGEKIFFDMEDAGLVPNPKSDMESFHDDSASLTDVDTSAIDEKSSRGKFSLEEYPSIFTKFKINTKLEDHQNMMKRDLEPAIASAAKIDKSQIVEEQLKNILNEMGLIEPEETHEEKRAAEDENLEYGTNKLNLVKEEKIREVRDAMSTTEDTSIVKRSATSKDSQSAAGTTPCSGSLVHITTANRKKRQNERKSNSVQISNESKSRKRDKRQKAPIINDLEKSGNLKLTGNTAPLASESETDKSANLDEYEKRVEREIKDKIKALKEEVKREIQKEKELLKSNKDIRKKRQVNTLEEEESRNLDPNLNLDQKLVPHVRRRRSLEMLDNNGNLTTNKNNAKKFTNPAVENPRFISRKLKEASEDQINSRNRREVSADNYENEPEAQFNEGQSSCTGSNCQNSGRSGSSGSHCTCDSSGHCSCGSGFKDDKSEMNEGESEEVEEYEDESKFEDDTSNAEARKSENTGRKKRRSILIPVYEEAGNDYAGDYENNNYEEDSIVKRQAEYGNKYRENPAEVALAKNSYFVDMHPSIFRLSPDTIIEEESPREKRQSFEKGLSALHGGGPIENHIVAIRSRSMGAQAVPHSRFRRRVVNPEQPKQLIDMSDEELFGALPQSFEGELNRYKRVKRTETNTKKM